MYAQGCVFTKPVLRRCLKQTLFGKHRAFSVKSNSVTTPKTADVPANLIAYNGIWPMQEQKDFVRHMRVVTDFISAEEEQQLIEEVEPYMKRLRYEYDHWDDAIHGFRETERKKWYPHNRNVLERIRKLAFDGAIMPYVHVLDLAAEGVIKPHVDSTRYCGDTIAGVSLLTDCVMRLIRINAQKYKQNSSDYAPMSIKDNDTYRDKPEAPLENNFYADILLPRRSLYIMSHTARYNFTHEILADEKSQFQGATVRKERRISIICRNEP